jgi:pimeloyl-[acyl-carrier protein] synthase
MRKEQIAFPIIRQVVKRPSLTSSLFRMMRTENTFAPEFYVDPYPTFNTWRDKGPVFFHPVFGQWMVTGFAEAQELLRSTDTSVSENAEALFSVRPYSQLSDQARSGLKSWMLLSDPPDHTRLRALVSRTFTPKRLASWEPRSAAVANELIEIVRAQTNPDVVSEFTTKLPIYVIGEILGLPRERWDWLKTKSDMVAKLLDPFLAFDPVVMNRQLDELRSYFLEVAALRRAEPHDDLISALVQAVEGDVLTDDEFVAMVELLMMAGHETTTLMLGNSIVALAAHLEQRELFRSQPELRSNAVDELLRFDTSVTTVVRLATRECTLGGKTIKKGARIAVLPGAANRDPRRFADANELKLDRENPHPISFGNGMHHCIGATLARMELRIGIGAFVDAFGDHTVDPTTIIWKQSGALRGPVSLRVQQQPTVR